MLEAQTTIRNLLLIATLAPLVSAILNIFLGKRMLGKASALFATLVMAGAFGCAVAALIKWNALPANGRLPIVTNVPWIPLSSVGLGAHYLYLGILVDGLTVAMMTMVTFIAMLVHVYSLGYMAGDTRYERFFAYLSLFSFTMLGSLISNSIMELFVFWELVGLTSYLLIGFWFEKRGPQLACKKAFVMNRVGDMGFLIGFGILFYKLSGNVLLPAAGLGDGRVVNMFDALQKLLAQTNQSITNPPMWLTVAGIGLFCGAIGKSAQFPLHTWLPDAMEGPTPVSSIVHSATMVAAGVYLTARIYPILTPGAHLFVATIGLITLVMAACMAMVMTDIKRVLAYSTLSQLGYMILGLGSGAYVFALYHLITHAFFKCCLFQCAGSVIHGANHQQDMRYYGGLGKKMPITATCYGICMLAIAGASIPMTPIGISGFYSKDGIIAGTVNYGQALGILHGQWGSLFYLGPIVIAYITSFYMARSFALTFLGKPRDQFLYDHAHEAPATMFVPQICLAVMAFLASPYGSWLVDWKGLIASSTPAVAWVQPGVESQMEHAFHFVHHWVGYAWILGIGMGIAMYYNGMAISSRIVAIPGINLLYTWAVNKFYFDGLYDGFIVAFTKGVAQTAAWIDRNLIDGLVNGAGLLTKFVAWATGMFDNKVVDGAVNGRRHHGPKPAETCCAPPRMAGCAFMCCFCSWLESC